MSDPGVEKVSQHPTEKAFDGDSSDRQDHGHGEVTFIGDHGAESELQRKLSTRHITMIALGSSIGMGLWLGSGSSLASGGPAAMFLGYLLSGTMIWTVSQSIGEMAVMYPLPSAFVQWSTKFVDPAAGFAVGWAYWFNYFITIANELQAVNTVLMFWTTAVPIAAWMTIFWVVIILVNVGAVNWFGEIEVVCSLIKFGWIFVVIISGIVISAGGAAAEPVGFQYWNSMPFLNGFKGFLSVMPTCIFAMAGSENAGLVAAETKNPRRSVPKAVASIWIRLSLFYIMGSLIVTINVSPLNEDIFGGSGTNASPFVIMYRQAGVMPLAHIMNAVIFISVLSTGTISGFAGSRTLLGLSQIGMAPKIMQKADKMGRPWYGLVPTLLVGGGLAYLNVSYGGAEVFGWGMICLSNIRMRHAWKIQGRSADELPWKSWTWPYGAYWGLSWCIILIIAEFYLAVWPLGEKPSVEHFFSVYCSVIAVLVLYIGAKIYYRNGKWVDAATIDLDAGRRFYRDQEVEEVL